MERLGAGPTRTNSIEHLPEHGRFRLLIDDREVAVLDYRKLPGTWNIVHTYTDPASRGYGVASDLVRVGAGHRPRAGREDHPDLPVRLLVDRPVPARLRRSRREGMTDPAANGSGDPAGSPRRTDPSAVTAAVPTPGGDVGRDFEDETLAGPPADGRQSLPGVSVAPTPTGSAPVPPGVNGIPLATPPVSNGAADTTGGADTNGSADATGGADTGGDADQHRRGRIRLPRRSARSPTG